MTGKTDSEIYATLYNDEAEKAVLGSLMIDPDAFDEIGVLTKNDFGNVKCATIFEALQNLYEQNNPLDYITVVDKLQEGIAGRDGWGPVEVADLISATPTAMYASHYAEIVRKRATLRRQLALTEKIAKAIFDPSADPSTISLRAAQAFEKLSAEGETVEGNDLKSAVERQFERVTAAAEAREKGEPIGIFSGWALDRLVGGFQSGNVITIAARPGAGKSSFALALALRFAERGFMGAFFSVEMSEAEVVGKMLANIAAINSKNIRSGELTLDEMTALMPAASKLAGMPMYVVDTQCSTVQHIRRHLRKMIACHDIKYAVIDYVQLLNASDDVAKGENRVQVMSAISRSIKQMAKELDITVFLISQLNRGVEQRENKRPLMSDLRESGGLEQDADVILMLYRDDYYNPESEDQNVVEISVVKNRHGDTGVRKMHFTRETARFHDLEFQRVELNEHREVPVEPPVIHLAPHSTYNYNYVMDMD